MARVYILHSGHKVHFKQLEPYQGGPTKFVARPAGSGEVVVVMDPEPERSAEEILDDCSQLSYREEEQLSEASNVFLPSKRPHWMDTRLRTRMRARGNRLHYQQFDYSTSDPERERSEDLLSDVLSHSKFEAPALVDSSRLPDEQPLSPEPANNDELPIFSEPEILPDVSQAQDAPTENTGSRNITNGYICSALDKLFIDECASHYSPIAGWHLQPPRH